MNMKRWMMAMALCMASWGSQAQEMATLFVAMPDQQIPQLEDAWRKDLVDLFQQGKEARVQNTMNGFSSLKQLTADYLLLQVTERSTVEMKLLPLVNNTKVVCVVTTVFGPVPDSRVDFFSPDWEPLPADELMPELSASDFQKVPADTTDVAYLDALALLDMELIHYTLSPDQLTLSATYTTPRYLSEADQQRVAPFVQADPVVLTWQKSHFVR